MKKRVIRGCARIKAKQDTPTCFLKIPSASREESKEDVKYSYVTYVYLCVYTESRTTIDRHTCYGSKW